MTTNERLAAAGLLDEIDHAIRRRDRESMVSLLKKVDLSQQAEAISEAIVADRTLYGRAVPWSFDDANAFLARVTARLRSMLDSASEPLSRLGLAKDSWDWGGGPLILYLEPESPYDGTFEGKPIIDQLNRRLNEECANEPCYSRIIIQVPNRFLGKQFLTQQDEDNKAYRRIRLRGRAERRPTVE